MLCLCIFRAKGYALCQETKLYYLQSRYYNPEVGRFLNADAYASTGQGVLSNNMFAYCQNNPVVLADTNGEFAVTAILIGFATGFVGQYIADVISNVRSGKTGVDALTPKSSVIDYLASGVGGAIAAIPGGGALGALATGALGNITSEFIKGNINCADDLVYYAAVGAVANGIGYGVSRAFATGKVNQINNMPRAVQKNYLKNNIFHNGQVNKNVNRQIFATNSFQQNISLVQESFLIFQLGIYSTGASTLSSIIYFSFVSIG